MDIFSFFKRNSTPRNQQPRQQQRPISASPIAYRDTSAISTIASFSVLDLETTGFSPTRDRIVEIGIVRLSISGEVVDEWHTRINPQRPMSATEIHGITDEDVASSPNFSSSAQAIAQYLNGTQIVAHNASFDISFLSSEFQVAGWEFPEVLPFCTLKWATQRYPELHRHTLSHCCDHLGIQQLRAHSALSDARATSEFFRRHLVAGEFASQPFSPMALTPLPARAPRNHPALHSEIISRRITHYKKPEPLLLIDQIQESSSQQIIRGFEESLGAISYSKLLVRCLEDGALDESELSALGDLRESYGLNPTDTAVIHMNLFTAISDAAYADGKISNREKTELLGIASTLGIEANQVREVFKASEKARQVKLSANLRSLPPTWHLGEPLRVGDKVVFTGGDDSIRGNLEAKSVSAGLLLMGGVSKMVKMLVSDGDFSGTKLARARELNTRIVNYTEFQLMLEFIQPPETL